MIIPIYYLLFFSVNTIKFTEVTTYITHIPNDPNVFFTLDIRGHLQANLIMKETLSRSEFRLEWLQIMTWLTTFILFLSFWPFLLPFFLVLFSFPCSDLRVVPVGPWPGPGLPSQESLPQRRRLPGSHLLSRPRPSPAPLHAPPALNRGGAAADALPAGRRLRPGVPPPPRAARPGSLSPGSTTPTPLAPVLRPGAPGPGAPPTQPSALSLGWVVDPQPLSLAPTGFYWLKYQIQQMAFMLGIIHSTVQGCRLTPVDFP